MTPAPHLKLSRLRRAQPGDGAPAAPRPEPPAPADGPHPGSADLGRRLAESAFAQLAPLWSAARGNPSDPFGGSLGGLSATGTVTDRQFGRYLPVFWGELDLRAQRVLARHLCDTNPFAIGFLQLLKGYHVRTGFGWQACLKGQKKGAYSTAGGGDPLVAKAQNVLDAFRDRSQWPLKSREAFLRWRRDGEVFVRFGSGGYGRLPWVRFVDPEQVGSPVGDTGTGASFGIETEDGDHETPLRYHVWDADDPTSGEWVDAGRVIHLRANVDSGVKRGVTDFYALSEALDNTRRLLHTMLATAVKQARVAWVEKIAGTQQQALSAPEYAATATNRLQPYQVVDDFTRALSDQFGRFGIGGQHLSDVRRVEGSRQFEPGPAANSAGYIQVEQAALRACGVRWNFPEYFSGDASNNNMASSVVAGSPFTVTVEGNQLEYGHGFERPAALKVLELARDAGVLSYDEWARLDVEVTEPAVATPDRLKDTQVYTSQLQAKIVSLDTVRQKLGYDPRHEAEGVKKDAAEQAPPAPPGGDGPPGGAGDGAQLPPDDGGGGGLGDPLGESAEYVTEGLYALLSEADRSHLVPKQITDKLGRKRTVYVRPDEQVAAQKARGDAFRAANAGLNPKEVLQKRKADAEPARQAARAEYAKAVSDPANYDPEAMAQHLERLTRDELREHARAVQARVTGLKGDLINRLLDKLGGGSDRTAPGKPGDVRNVRTEELQVDPGRFQFKLNTNNPAGVTKELQGVQTFNPEFAGVVSVWRDPEDGKTYIVNGHHRHELAVRTGHPDLAVRYLDAKDAREARAKGALINIAEGRGTAVDAAKFMRDMGVSPDDLAKHGVSLKGKLAEDATTLTKLNDKAFDRVARGTLDADKALAVARHVSDPDRQERLFGILEKREDEGKDLSRATIEEMARQMAAAPAVKRDSSGSLFDMGDDEEDTFVQRAELSAHVRGALSQELNDFRAVASTRRAGRVADAGNQLNTDENRRRAQELEQHANVFDVSANRKGAVSDALDAGAVKLKQAKTKKERDRARAETLDAVRQAVRGRLDNPTADGRGEGGVDRGGGPAGAGDRAGAPAPDAGRGSEQPARVAPRRRGDETAPTEDEFAAASAPAQQSGQNPSTGIDKQAGGSNTTPTPPASGGNTSGGSAMTNAPLFDDEPETPRDRAYRRIKADLPGSTTHRSLTNERGLWIRTKTPRGFVDTEVADDAPETVAAAIAAHKAKVARSNA